MTDAPAGPADGQANIKGSLPLYKQPVPINEQQHKGMGLKYGDRPFEFLAGTHFVPLTWGEFAMAGANFPVIFLGENKTPVAAMGLRANENLFVDPETFQYAPYTYLPAFVRRYPFVGANDSNDPTRFLVCVDAGSPLFSDEPTEPFFIEDGKPSPFLERAIDFVRRFENDVQSTQNFIKTIEDLELFDEQQATFQPRDAQGNPSGDPQVVATYWAVSGEKLRALPADKLVELRDNTMLGAMYAHMLSLSQWDFLIQRAVARQNPGLGAERTVVAPPPAPEA